MSTIKNGDQIEVIAGTHAGKSGKVEDRNVSKTGAVTITVRMADGDRVKTLAKNVRPKAKAVAKSAATPSIDQYVAAIADAKARAVAMTLRKQIDKTLPKLESKIWHRTPVWFDEGNPLVGIFVLKNGGVKLMFWSGQSFKAKGLTAEGGFKMAVALYTDAKECKPTQIAGWLREAKRVQWDHKNIVKRRGKLVKLGTW